MIGSLIFHVLYPLSQYLTSRPPVGCKRDLPPSTVNGTAVWDGGSVTNRKFTQLQRTTLDQRFNPNGGTQRETKERMTDPVPEKEDDTRPDTTPEQLTTETKNEAAPKMSEVQAGVMCKERGSKNVPLQDKVEGLKPEDWEDEFQITEDGGVVPSENIDPEQELTTQLECLKTEDRTQETTYPVQTKEEILSLAELVTLAAPSMQETTCPVQEVPSVLQKVAAEVTECWDEYLAPAHVMCGGENSELIFAPLLSTSQTHLNVSGSQDAQPGWHFPAGPGLAEEVQCPLWQFPAVSYYPSLEPTEPFEVMWRVWEKIDESASAAEPELMPCPFTKATLDFTVMSYNILAQDLLEANPDLYTHCPLEVLEWSYRYSLLLEEILKWAPDILCLQEVQENHYNEQLHPVLSEMGYTCVYKRRTGSKTDGCATCYRSSCFSEMSVTLLEFFRPETELLDRQNVGIVLLLQPEVTRESEVKAKGPPLCVANTHLLFNPKRGDVKLAQLAMMLAEIDSAVKYCKARGEHCNVILCGDFNSVPHMPLYQLITTSELYFQGLPAWQVSGQEDLSYRTHCLRLFAPLWPSCLGITDSCQYTTVNETFQSQSPKPGKRQYSHEFLLQLRFCPATLVRPLDLEVIPGVTDNTPDPSSVNQPYEKRFSHIISHRLDLESVYQHILPGSGNPEVTTLHAEGGATVDYIFYTPRRSRTTGQQAGGDSVKEGLKLLGSLSLLSEDVLWSMRGLPNNIFPSDHLSLLAKFQLYLNSA